MVSPSRTAIAVVPFLFAFVSNDLGIPYPKNATNNSQCKTLLCPLREIPVMKTPVMKKLPVVNPPLPETKCTTLLCPLVRNPPVVKAPVMKNLPVVRPSPVTRCTTLLCPLVKNPPVVNAPTSSSPLVVKPLEIISPTASSPSAVTPSSLPEPLPTGISLNPNIPYTGKSCYCTGPETGDNCSQVCHATLAAPTVCAPNTRTKYRSECHAKCEGEPFLFNLRHCDFFPPNKWYK